MRAYSLLGCVALICSAGVLGAEAQTPLQACYASSPNRSAVGLCLERKLRDADAAMASALASARQEATRLDTVTGHAQSVKALSAAQKEFLAYRNANCSWYAARMSAGTGSGDVAQDCMIRMTRARADELRTSASAGEAAGQPSLLTESSSVMAWQGVDWKLTKLVREGKDVPLVANSKVTANFHAAGRVAGMASVNRYFGSYKAGGDGRIEWAAPGFGATRMAGPPQLMQQEGLFLDALGKVSTARMEGTRLILANDDGSVELTFER